MTDSLYDKIVGVLEHYLGPAAPRFVDRQIISHLQKDPHDVTREDLEHLSEWVRVSLALLTDDTKSVEEATNRIAQLL